MSDINGKLLEAIFNKNLNDISLFKSIQHYKECITLRLLSYIFFIAALTVFFVISYMNIVVPFIMVVTVVIGIFSTIYLISELFDMRGRYNSAMNHKVRLSKNETDILDDTFSVFTEFRHTSFSATNITLAQLRDIINVYYTVQNAKLETYQMFSNIN